MGKAIEVAAPIIHTVAPVLRNSTAIPPQFGVMSGEGMERKGCGCLRVAGIRGKLQGHESRLCVRFAFRRGRPIQGCSQRVKR